MPFTTVAEVSSSGTTNPFDPIYVEDFNTLRGIDTGSMLAFVTDIIGASIPDSISGWFLVDANDTTSVDDANTIIVATDGRRWKRITDSRSDKLAAKDWATKTTSTVDGILFSAKEYAQGVQAATGGSALSWAQQTGADVPGAPANSRSAKSWAQEVLAGALLGGSAKDWAQSAVKPDGVSESAKTYAGQSSASATAAQIAQAAAEAASRIFTTRAAGEAAVPTVDQHFFVRQGSGFYGYYEYIRTAGGSKFFRMITAGALKGVIDSQRALRGTLTAPNVPGALIDIRGSDSWEWDGRVLINGASTTLPTLNLYPSPFNALDELGTTPAREPATATTTDSAGTNYALKLTATAQAQQLTTWRSTYGAIPVDDYRLHVEAKFLGGVSGAAAQWRLGVNTTGFLVNATGAWTSFDTTLAAYAGATDIGFASNTGNTDGVVAIANFCMYDSYAGETASLPTFAQELAAQSGGHMKKCLAYAGSFSLTGYGGINMDGATGAAVATLDPDGVLLSNGYWFGGWFNTDSTVPLAAQAVAWGFDAHLNLTSGANGATHGQLGLYGVAAGPSSPGRPGKPYAQPNVNNLASTPCPIHNLPGQGLQHIAVSVVPNTTIGGADMTLWLNGVPNDMKNIPGWTAPRASRMLFGDWNNTGELHKLANPWKGIADFLYLYPFAPTQAQMTARDKYMIQQLRLDGGQPGDRKEFLVFDGDSLTGFGPSWAFHLAYNSSFSPRLHGVNLAVGGTNLGQAATGTRLTARNNIISAAVAAGYKKVKVIGRWGTNELVVGASGSWITNNGHAVWRDTVHRPLITATKALGPGIVEWVHVTMPPARQGLSLGNMATELTYTQYCQNYNADYRANYLSYSIDDLIDLGLGTETMTAIGVFAAETTPGGRFMNNWRTMHAAMTSPTIGSANRSPATTLALSAAAGSAITATAGAAGTFLYHDVGRKIVAGAAGYGVITAIDGTGTTATVDTTDIIPVAWPGEAAEITTQDSVSRGGGFSATNFISGAWSIQSCSERWNTDGIHQSNPGGREECDYAAPKIKTWEAAINGLVS